jgi:hypothetical protein
MPVAQLVTSPPAWPAHDPGVLAPNRVTSDSSPAFVGPLRLGFVLGTYYK